MKKYYVVQITKNDEFHTGPFDTPQEAVKEANKAWDHLTSWEKKKTQIEVRQYVADIEADDCTDFDYDTINWNADAVAAELREMASLGWEKQEAYDSKEAFLERLGEVAEGFSEEEIFRTWENVWEQLYDEMTGGIPYWFDPDGITLYKKTFDGNEEIWSGSYEDAGTFEGDPEWQFKLNEFFEKEFGIKNEEWEVG